MVPLSSFGHCEVVVERRYAEYRPVSRWRRWTRVPLFRTVRLKSAGWAAVALVCATGAGAGYAVSLLIDLPGQLGMLLGAFVALTTLVFVTGGGGPGVMV
jgi:hypothetical protein